MFWAQSSLLEDSYCGIHACSFCQAKTATPQTTRERSAERERKEMGWQSWRAVTASAKDWEEWRAFLIVLRCSAGHDEG